MAEEIERQILAAVDGLRLDLYLARRFSAAGRRVWQERITAGKVLVNGRPVRPAHRLQRNSQISFFLPDRPEPEVDSHYSYVYRDADYAVINKPANLPVHPAGPYRENTLLHLVEKKDGARPHLISRLDRETSGCLLVAWNPLWARFFFKERQKMRKEYAVLVEGAFPDSLLAHGFLQQDLKSAVRKKRSFTRHPDESIALESASTEFFREGYDAHRQLSFVRAVLHTGRMHQIRATLCSLGYPVVGDLLYGIDEGCYLRFLADALTPEDRSRLRLKRMALHSWKLSVPLMNGDSAHYECELPDEFKTA